MSSSEMLLAKGYEPKDIEDYWRSYWEDNSTFTPLVKEDDNREPYSLVFPPPNVTGNLHIGHALNLTLQDILCRHARQIGKQVLWIPGEDHAGIATQNVVERRLALDGKTRDDLGREAFIERVWAWKEEYGDNIRRQIKAMGASVDWNRERFTMDEGLSKAVRKVFVKLYNEKLIYKGRYIINWCNRCHTALADDEVDHSAQKTNLWYIRYPLEDNSGHLIIATTRPETLLGDTAVCVNPEDERYKHLVGKRVILPLVNKSIPIIADSYVDKEFGTGALKVTPAHDHNDWSLGQKHNLEVIQVINDLGAITAEGPYLGLSKEEARKQIVKDLEEKGFLEKTEEYENSVGFCYRCSSVIEPHVSEQWFVSVKPLAEQARQAVPDDTQIIPSSWLKTYYSWLDNIRDWCISRQIWWGHRIPAWVCEDCGELMVKEEAPSVCDKCSSSKLIQEDDVLDTWFSSAIWSFSTLGWPNKTIELERFYPNAAVVTAFDILFFWIARMMMMGIHFMGKVPFKHIYIHALIRDAEGKKMSKSTGNVIDPLVMIDKYGTDALRFTLSASAAMGRDIRLAEDRIEGYKHFMNKIWNAARFSLMHITEVPTISLLEAKEHGLHHKWILHSLEELKDCQRKYLEEYRFSDASQEMYKFVWQNFCDWYLELIKPDIQAGGSRKDAAICVLWTVLREVLILLHPFIPFISSELWKALPALPETKTLSETLFPEGRDYCVSKKDSEQMEMVQEAIVAIRTIRSELNIPPSLKLNVKIKPMDESSYNILTMQKDVIITLARLEGLEISFNIEIPKASASQIAKGNDIIVELKGAVDFNAEIARLDKELGKIQKDLQMVDGKLANPNYINKAPAEVVAKDKERQKTLKESFAKMTVLKERFVKALE